MRNEELEQLLQQWMQRCWSLKQVILEQQKLISAQTSERKQHLEEVQKGHLEAENAYSFAKYECNKYWKVIGQEQILQGVLSMAQQNLCDQKNSQYKDDRLRLAQTKQNEILIDLESAKTKNEVLQEEMSHCERNLDNMRSQMSEQLIQIFEKVDPQRAMNALGQPNQEIAD